MDDAKTQLAQWMRDNKKGDQDVADALGNVTRSQVNRLKNGASQPSYPTAVALEALTGIPASRLFDEPEERAAA